MSHSAIPSDAIIVKIKPKLTISEQIQYMKERQGIRFSIISEEEAEHFLKEHTYFFKLKSFARNYAKNTSGPNAGKYSNLEFAYLKELSTLDMYLRERILRMTMDIEHYLKLRLINFISEDDTEDGYSIVDAFLGNNSDVRERIQNKQMRKNSPCRELLESNDWHFAIWNIAEVLSFGDFIRLYSYYIQCHGEHQSKIDNCLYPVRFLRNAAAHNNGLLRNLKQTNLPEFKKNKQVCSYISKKFQERGIQVSANVFKKKTKNQFIHDFSVMLYVFHHIVTSEPIQKKSMEKLIQLFDGRFLQHQDYFESNDVITSSYKFVRNVIDIFS